MVSFSCRISPRTSTVIFLERSPFATAIVTSAMLRTCAVRLPAIWLTDSVSSFQTPETPFTCAWPPSLPSVPTSRATRVTSDVKTESWSIILLTSFAERRNSPSSGRPSTSRAMDWPRSPFATAPTARVTSVVGQTRSSISVLIASTSLDQPPTTPGTVMRCLSLPSFPTARLTRAVSRARRSLSATTSLKASAILPSTPRRSAGIRAAKSPARKDSMADSSARENWSESTGATAVPTVPVIPLGAPDLVVSSIGHALRCSRRRKLPGRSLGGEKWSTEPAARRQSAASSFALCEAPGVRTCYTSPWATDPPQAQARIKPRLIHWIEPPGRASLLQSLGSSRLFSRKANVRAEQFVSPTMPRSRVRRAVGVSLALFVWMGVPLCAQTVQPAPPAVSSSARRITAVRLATPPAIDGVLDDGAWATPEVPADQWRSYNPLHGDTVPHMTHVWIGYDARYLYFAFQCDDPEPAKIKTSITRRDNIFSDDWVGLSLDALGTGQVSYHMMVNPSGIQLDMLNSSSGEEDMSPDWVWESAGLRNDRGYAVEIRLPLESVQFRGGDAVRMGILFWRRVSRIGVSVAWPALEPGTWVFDKHASLMFDHLEPRLAREVIPSATYVWSEARTNGPAWSGTDNHGDIGFSTRLGLTPTITLDATVNPDFSQVESDAFQVEVNQRFPNFFSEKRPFFMQGSDVFKLAGVGNGDSSMFAAVHTRRIGDPIVGAKVTGSAGRVSFGSLLASDEAPGRELVPGEPGDDANRLFNVGRAQYSLGPGSFAGAIATQTRFAGDENGVLGADVSWRPRASDRVSAFVLQSWSDRQGHRDAGVAMLAN